MSRQPVPRVLVPRSGEQAPGLVEAIRRRGLEPVVIPAIEVELQLGADLRRAVADLYRVAWVVVTSANGARAVLRAAEHVAAELGAPSWAAVGGATAAVLEAEGIEVDVVPDTPTAAGLASALPIVPGQRVLVVRGDLADDGFVARLRARGAHVDDVIGYRTLEAPPASRPLLADALERGLDAAIVTSGSTVRGLLELATPAHRARLLTVPLTAIGPRTAEVARAAGFRVAAIAERPDDASLADAVTTTLLAGVPR